MPTYKFKYFNARGLGETSRLLFALAGQEYEDIRVSREEWPTEKPKTPFGQMPILEIDGKPYCQSSAIARYLARTFGFYGKDDIEALEVDQVLGIGQDVANAFLRARFEKDEAKKAELEKENKEVKMPLYLGMYEKILKGKGNGHFVGDKISLADVFVFDQCQKLEGAISLDEYPELKKCREIVASDPKIKAWIEKRPVTEM